MSRSSAILVARGLGRGYIVSTLMTIVVVAEKPSVARDIAKVLGASQRREGYLEGKGYRVTWALGHLVALGEPAEVDPRWKAWRKDSLPMIPERWPLKVLKRTRKQYGVVERLLKDPSTTEVVAATDAGREGELIFRYIYERAGCDRPVKRLWISSLTPGAIRKGFDGLADGARFDGLAAAAKGRSRADWLVGMNLSRAYSLTFDDKFSVGRVQTPTLSMVVDRERAIRDFVVETYHEVEIEVQGETGGFRASYCGGAAGSGARRGSGSGSGLRATRFGQGEEGAAELVTRAMAGVASVVEATRRTRKTPPERLYDLTELQRHANRLFGFSAKKTLDLAQDLYEKQKVLSYPRTDSRHISLDIAGTLPEIVRVVSTPYAKLLAPGTGERPLGKRFVDDAKVTDHHAIIPTSTPARGLSGDHQKIYDLVCRRLLAAWHEDHVDGVTTVNVEIRPKEPRSEPVVDPYFARGTTVEKVGWKVLEPTRDRRKGAGNQSEPKLPPALAAGQPLDVKGAKSVEKKTRPPRPFTEATLLTAMETAGRKLDNAALSGVMREAGLGTPATRAATIETLLSRDYIRREQKALRATDKGMRLVSAVHEQVRSPKMTAEWELRLRRLSEGEGGLDDFMRGIEGYVREVVEAVKSGRRIDPRDEVDRALAAGRDARSEVEKSCLPDELRRRAARLRAGPLLVLVDDEAAATELAAALKSPRGGVGAIHGGHSREASRATCRAYLEGKVGCLIVDRVTLAVPGFPEMLTKRRPGLVALIDLEADGREVVESSLSTLRPTPRLEITQSS